MFKGEELAEAVGVPLFYGLVEAVVLGKQCYTYKVLFLFLSLWDLCCCILFSFFFICGILSNSVQIHDILGYRVVLCVCMENRMDKSTKR